MSYLTDIERNLSSTWEDLEARLEHRKHHPHPNPPPGPVAPPASAPITVRLVNRSQHVTDAAIAAAATDLQTQVSHDFTPAWLIEAAIVSGGQAQAGEWPLLIEDDASAPGALGFHEELAGVPTGHVFTQVAMANNVVWTGVASHELLEMLGDPRTVLGAIVDPNGDGKSGRFVLAEACDAVEQSTYTVGSTVVSDFVLPAWWDVTATGPFDHLGLVTAPLQLEPGGSYVGEIVFQSVNGWETPTASKAAGLPW